MIQVHEEEMHFFGKTNPDILLLFLQPNTYRFLRSSIPASPILIELPPPHTHTHTPIYATEHNYFPNFFLETYPILFLRNYIPYVGLKSHNPAPFVFFFKAALTPPPPPHPGQSHIHTGTYQQFSRFKNHPPFSGVA